MCVTGEDSQMVIVPENDLDKLLLKSITEGTCEIVSVKETMSILGKSIMDGVIIRQTNSQKSQKKDD